MDSPVAEAVAVVAAAGNRQARPYYFQNGIPMMMSYKTDKIDLVH